MNKILRCAAVAAMAVGFSLSTLSQVDAASVVLVPLVNNVVDREDLGSIYYDRTVEAVKNADSEILDNKDVDQALEKNTKPGILPTEADLKEIASATGADIVVAMQVDQVSREDITVFNNAELDMIVKCEGAFASYNAMNGKYKRTGIRDEDRMPMSVGARYDVPGEMFANNVTRQIKRALGVKKVSIEKPRISKSGFKGNM